MKRLLCIVGSMNAGGAETFLMKIYRTIDRRQYQMDFAVTAKGIYDEEIISLGGRLHYITPKSKGAWKNFSDIRNLVKREKYKSVLRVSQNSLSALELFAAQLGGAKIRAYRSSNSNTVNGTSKEIIIHKLFRWMPLVLANVRFAPSTEAAEFMFGKGCIQNGRAFILHNGLDIQKYAFDQNARDSIRNEIGINDELVVGHVGRFNQQKNHEFLIKVFSELISAGQNAILVLCGTGEKETAIKRKVEELGLTSRVRFLGVRTDVEKILSAMDVFVFPSLYEGLPNVVIEAQTNGLLCVISDTITREVAITDLVSFVSISSPISDWKETIMDLQELTREVLRKDYPNLLMSEGYSINDCGKIFTNKLY